MTKRTNDILTKLQLVLSEDNKALLDELLAIEYDQGYNDGREEGKAESGEPDNCWQEDYEDRDYEDVDDPNDYPPDTQEF